MNSAGRKPVLPKHEFDRLAKQLQALPEGDPKRTRLVNKLTEHNLKLVVRFVVRFMKSKGAKDWGTDETLDYLQVGTLGLRRAIEKYDPTRGYCFSTYAQHWMRSFVGRYNYKEMSLIDIPESSCRAAFSYKKYGVSVGSCAFKAENAEMLTKKVFAAAQLDSLDREIADGVTLGDTALQSLEANDTSNRDCFGPDIEMMFDKAGLSEDYKTILRYRYIDGMTFKEMSLIMGLDQRVLCSYCSDARKRLQTIIKPGTVCV